jgi:hypothetical protein
MSVAAPIEIASAMRARETVKGWEGVKVVGFRRSQSTEEVAWLASPRSIFWGVALIVLGMNEHPL